MFISLDLIIDTQRVIPAARSLYRGRQFCIFFNWGSYSVANTLQDFPANNASRWDKNSTPLSIKFYNLIQIFLNHVVVTIYENKSSAMTSWGKTWLVK